MNALLPLSRNGSITERLITKVFTMNVRKIILVSAVVIAAGGAFYGWNEYNRGHVSTNDIKPVAFREAAELVKEFEDDETTANLQYNDKVVSVTGRIVKMEINDSTHNLLLAGESAMAGVLCQFETSGNHPLSKIKTGDLVKVKGVCTGALMDVILTRCILDQ
jgi:tRNA_anti-like